MRLFRHAMLLASFSLVLPLAAQEYRATVLGSVLDPSGMGMAGAKVTVTNRDTAVSTAASSDAAGNYQIPLLNPGWYILRVEQTGFKNAQIGPFELRVNDRTTVDVRMEMGQVTETVTVQAEPPLVEAASADRGQVISAKVMTDMPVPFGNPYALMSLASGVVFHGSEQDMRPHDNGGNDNFVINGGSRGMNDFVMDGVSTTTIQANGRPQLGYVPPAEALQEFKIQTSAYDAQNGRSGGSSISISVKAGTNEFHGSVYEYMRRPWLSANHFVNNMNGTAKPNRILDQYGGTIGGPVILPKLYNGRNKTFFMFATDRSRDWQPNPRLASVPTLLQRAGDFSQTLNSAGALWTIYDPESNYPNPGYDPSRAVSLTNLRNMRAAFPGNVIPKTRMDPVGSRFMNDYMVPNTTGDSLTQANNFAAPDAKQRTYFDNWLARVDHNISQTWKLDARWNHSVRWTPAEDEKGADNQGNTSPSRYTDGFNRFSDGAAVGLVATPGARTIFNLRLGFQRFNDITRTGLQDLSWMNWPKSLVAQMPTPGVYPRLVPENYWSVGAANTIYGGFASDTYSAHANATRIQGSHTIRVGFEYRLMRAAQVTNSNGNSNLTFNRNWTSLSPDTTDPRSGNAVATALLGWVSGGSATINGKYYYSYHAPMLFFQDDWKVSRRLTLNLGLRWDYESPAVERFNQQSRGFGYNDPSPIQVPGMTLKGVLYWAGVDGQPRGAFLPNYRNFAPRIGGAFRLSDKFVLRGGFGRYFIPTADAGANSGYTQATNITPATSTFERYASVQNPFPDGLTLPVGNSRGGAMSLGDSLTFNDQNRVIPTMDQFSAGLQYEIKSRLLVEASYVGSRGNDLQISRNLNFIPLSELEKGTAYLNQSVPNPFFGILPRSTSRGGQANTQRRNLVVPYPQYSGLTAGKVNLGRSWYNSLQAKVEQRFRNGLFLLVSYTFSKSMETMSFKNPQDENLSRELMQYHVPHTLALSGLYELPVGPRKTWISNGLAAKIVGGWSLGWVFVANSGFPMNLPDFYINGDPRLASGQTLDRWFNTSSSLWTVRPPDTLRTSPFRSPNIRTPSKSLLDVNIIRKFRLSEKKELQLKASAFNAANTPVFTIRQPDTNPTSLTFGQVPKSQGNQPRNIELGLRFAF